MILQAEKEIAKARMEVAHEVRLAKEAEAAMDMHVAKAGQKAQRELAKHNMTSASATASTGMPNTMAPPTNNMSGPPHHNNPMM